MTCLHLAISDKLTPLILEVEESGEYIHNYTHTHTHTHAHTHTPDQSVMEQFGTNILSLAISDKLTPLILEVESESREKIHSAEEELEGSRCVRV